MSFDLNQHFKSYSQNLFFNEKTYSDLLSDVASFSQTHFTSLHIALKIKSPYYLMVALLGLINQKKSAVLISTLETSTSIELLKNQIQFDLMIEDNFFNNLKTPIIPFSFSPILYEIEAVIVFSSGTTNSPKGIALSFDNLYFSALGFLEHFKQKENDITLLNLPHNHVGGLMSLLRSFFSGGRLITDELITFDFISLVPLQLKRWISNPKRLVALQNCRVILIGGAPLTPELNYEALQLGLKLFETYGMSESTSLVCINGEVLPYREVCLDPEGFFLIKGKILSLGYYQNKIFSNHAPGWFKTNDLGIETSKGKFSFKQRADLIFISGGENINPLMIEEAARRNPKLQEAYLVSLPDEQWGEVGIMLYQAVDSISLKPQELREFLKAQLHPHHVPKFIFPCKLNFEGLLKPRRNQLKEMAQDLYLKNIFSYDFIKKDNAETVVFFHGFLGDKDDFKSIAQSISGHFSFLFISMPGHGDTKIENFYSLTDILKKLASFITLFDKTPIFYGYSMGGRISLQLALNYLTPKKLFLESAGPGLKTSEEKAIRSEHDLQLFSIHNGAKSFLDSWYLNPLFDVYRKCATFKNDCDKKALHPLSEWRHSQKYLTLGAFPLIQESTEQLKILPYPVIYIYGDQDIKYQNFAQYFSIVEVIKGAGHNPNKTHPSEITHLLNIFLK